jgi:hypothetical protein
MDEDAIVVVGASAGREEGTWTTKSVAISVSGGFNFSKARGSEEDGEAEDKDIVVAATLASRPPPPPLLLFPTVIVVVALPTTESRRPLFPLLKSLSP